MWAMTFHPHGLMAGGTGVLVYTLPLSKSLPAKGLVFEDAPTTTLILRWLVHLHKRATS
jgi:hypothetical protein